MATAAEVVRHKSNGICVDCESRPAAPYRTRCGECLNKQRGQVERHRQRRARYILENRCTMCGRPLDPEADNNHRLCINCRERDGRGNRI